MKTKAALWIVFATLSPICTGQQLPNAPSPIDYPFNQDAIPEMNGYKSVYIRRIDPDGIRIIHESGAAKIPIEKLTAEQRAQYALTIEGAMEYRQTLAQNELAAISAENELAAQIERQKPPQPSSPPLNFITAQQVKEAWIRRIQKPDRLDRNYKDLIRNYHDSISSIRAGSRDLEAQEAAANHNKNLAIRAGEIEIARTYESELARISKEKIAADERAAAAYAQAEAAREAERERMKLLELQSQLDKLEGLLKEKSCNH